MIVCSPKDRSDIEFDLAASRPEYRLERNVRSILRKAGYSNRFSPRGAAEFMATVLPVAPQHVEQLGVPVSMEETARWAGWCRSLAQARLGRIQGGANGGVSSHSVNDWIFELETARRFGFVPARFEKAVRVMRETATVHNLDLNRIGYWELKKLVRPSGRRTRRNVRRAMIAQRQALVMDMLENGRTSRDV